MKEKKPFNILSNDIPICKKGYGEIPHKRRKMEYYIKWDARHLSCFMCQIRNPPAFTKEKDSWDKCWYSKTSPRKILEGKIIAARAKSKTRKKLNFKPPWSRKKKAIE